MSRASPVEKEAVENRAKSTELVVVILVDRYKHHRACRESDSSQALPAYRLLGAELEKDEADSIVSTSRVLRRMSDSSRKSISLGSRIPRFTEGIPPIPP
ncbi:hypothetical protein RvY_00721-2 [Ramazzottius varieornatus]|uniref:Uncharacterized protein n=2 Tax=Ramazzottius varieornatus TaxID=947166 RepID=A0A1D1UDS4_RAMVA|nr:hypothetical protein RvY_00721-2 [Ramazzottius varieornatus]